MIAGEVCDIFIPDFCEEGIKRLVSNCRLVCQVIETNKHPGYYLVLYGMITLPAWGERRNTVLGGAQLAKG